MCTHINFNRLMLGLLLIAIGFMILKTWPEPDVFEPVQVAEAVDLSLETECLAVQVRYNELAEIIKILPGKFANDPTVMHAHNLMGEIQEFYGRVCHLYGSLANPVLPLHLTI